MESAKQNPITPTTTCKIPRKARIINLSLVALIAIAVISNIALLSKPVFHGTYKASLSSGETVTIRFYDNTYTTIKDEHGEVNYSTGFYKYIPATQYKGTYPDNIKIKCSVIEAPTTFYKKSVFKLTETDFYKSDFYCGTAIFLQVLYVLTIAISIIVLFCYNHSIQKKLQNKKAPKPIE